MLSIKRVPTVVSNYQKEGSDESPAEGCGRNCLKSCCIQGWYFRFYVLDFLAWAFDARLSNRVHHLDF